ncbi:Hypothetical predicted protein [Podarcis lilfordi]|uniref:Small integral membrane protein 26 n=1 Tax=Podarcis lilfordi TaxID=74358 RepID=A0AA35PCP4_9SAUR|nr:Hypothetical predicted protein [Podarcis lilfordi]
MNVWRAWKAVSSRPAMVYTFGVWTILGSIYIYTYSRVAKEKEAKQEREKTEEERVLENATGLTKYVSEDGRRKVVMFRTAEKGFTFNVTTTYKPNFVPLSTRLHNYIQSYFDDTTRSEK